MTLTAALGRGAGQVFVLLDKALEACMPAVKGMLVLLLGGTAWLGTDREPPFRLLALDQPPPVVAPGGALVMRAAVWRDVDRDCSMRAVSRIHFSDGSRLDLPTRDFTAQELRAQESRSPGRVAVALEIPAWAPVGPAYIDTTRYYQCNITHQRFPILSQNTWAFRVAR